MDEASMKQHCNPLFIENVIPSQKPTRSDKTYIAPTKTTRQDNHRHDLRNKLDLNTNQHRLI